MTIFDIKIASDVICPWCFLGERRLRRAIEIFRRTYPLGKFDTFNITHIPYLLNPEAPYPSIPIQQNMENKMGTERTAKVQEHMTSLGYGEGSSFKFGGKVGRSRDAHRLVQLAMKKDNDKEQAKTLIAEDGRLQDALMDRLYRAFIEEEKDLAEWDVLVKEGVSIGLGSEPELREWLESGAGGEAVDAALRALKEKGIQGVPWFEFNGTHVLDGARDPGDFFELLVQIKEQEQTEV